MSEIPHSLFAINSGFFKGKDGIVFSNWALFSFTYLSAFVLVSVELANNWSTSLSNKLHLVQILLWSWDKMLLLQTNLNSLLFMTSFTLLYLSLLVFLKILSIVSTYFVTCWIHHWLDGHEFEWTPGVGDGQGGLACCDSWGCKESDKTERLNWTEQNITLTRIQVSLYEE